MSQINIAKDQEIKRITIASQLLTKHSILVRKRPREDDASSTNKAKKKKSQERKQEDSSIDVEMIDCDLQSSPNLSLQSTMDGRYSIQDADGNSLQLWPIPPDQEKFYF